MLRRRPLLHKVIGSWTIPIGLKHVRNSFKIQDSISHLILHFSFYPQQLYLNEMIFFQYVSIKIYQNEPFLHKTLNLAEQEKRSAT